MKRVCKIHCIYLFSRIFWIMIALLIVLIVSIYYLTITNISINQSYQEKNDQYYYNIISYLKLILCFMNVFLFSNSINIRNDQSTYLILTTNISRVLSLSIKMVLICWTIFVFFFFQIAAYYLVGFVILKGFQFALFHLLIFFSTYLVAMYYGFLAMILMQLTQNWFAGIFPFFIYILSEDIVNKDQYTNFERLLFFIIPNVKTSDGLIPFGLFHLLLLILFLVIINFIIYQKKDM